jgi:hypothetical protein
MGACDRVVAALEARGCSPRSRGRSTSARCPAHDDHTPSLSVDCADGKALLLCRAGCPTDAVREALGLTWDDLFDEPQRRDEPIVYEYTDEQGKTLFEVVRMPGKQFRQRTPDRGALSGYRWDLKGTRRVLFHLRDVIRAVSRGEEIWITEGEKDADAVRGHGVCATTNPGGAGKWVGEYTAFLADASVTIWADADDVGRTHAQNVRHLLLPVAGQVRIVESSFGKDAYDHLGHGLTLDDVRVTVPYLEPDLAAPRETGEETATEHPPSPFVDVAALLAGGLPQPPQPVVCRRVDGCALFYRDQVNILFGDPESGKTWLAYCAAVEALADGHRVLIVDADHNGAQQVLSRLLALGADPRVLADLDRFRLSEPEDGSDLYSAVHEAAAWSPTVAVVDSIGEVMPILGKSSNSPDDYTDAHRLVLRPLALAGAAVIGVDHLAKSPESRQIGPTGTAAKGRAVGGVSLRVSLREPFLPGQGGAAALSIKKDRPGGLRARSPIVGRGEQPAGIFALTPTRDVDDPGRLRWQITKPSEDDAVTTSEVSGRSVYQPTHDDLAMIDGLSEEERRTVRELKAATEWGSDKATAVLREWRRLYGEAS